MRIGRLDGSERRLGRCRERSRSDGRNGKRIERGRGRRVVLPPKRKMTLPGNPKKGR